jgi:Nitroreductase family
MENALRFAVEQAVLAPSSHNTQPWRFRVEGDTVELHADRSRALPVADPHGRELVVSCGAALLNLELAIAHLGHEPEVTLFPEPSNPDLLARVRLGGERAPDPADDVLFREIAQRRTNRRKFLSRDVPEEVTADLRTAAWGDGVRLVAVREAATRRALAELVGEAHLAQFGDGRFRRELASWVTSNRSTRADGIPGYALGYGNLSSRFAPLAVRTLDLGRSQAVKSLRLARSASVLALVLTNGDRPEDWLAAGRALQRVLLTASAAGLAVSLMNQPLEVPLMRAEVGRVVGAAGVLQVLLRVGYAPRTRATPRRPASEVIVPSRG